MSEQLKIVEVFTDADIEFNKMIAQKGKNAMAKIKGENKIGRDYDFTSEVLERFRRKWGLFV